MTRSATLHELVGDDWFGDLVDRFYAGVADDPVLRPLYPEDLDDSRRWLSLFLRQYWGGAHDYDALRGHPRLRMRHAEFAIGEAERAAWMANMTTAVRAGGLPPEVEEVVLGYFEGVARHLVNRSEVADPGAGPEGV